MGGHYVKALVFQPPAVTTFPPSSGDKSNSRLPWLTLHTSQGGLIPALFINTQSKITILFSHGNAEDLGMCYDWLVEMSKALEVNIFAYEYEGYGKARSFQHFDSSQQELSQSSSSLLPTTAAYQAHKSSPSEEHCYQDIQTAFDYLTTSLQIASEHIVVFGRSLGSGPSLYLAELLAKQNINLGGIILQSAMTSILRVALPFRWTLPYLDMFPNIDRIRNIHSPVLLIHGTRDEIVPFTHAEELFEGIEVKWRACPFWIEGGGHNNLEIFHKDEDVYYDALKRFLLLHVPAYAFTSSLEKSKSLPGKKPNQSERSCDSRRSSSKRGKRSKR